VDFRVDERRRFLCDELRLELGPEDPLVREGVALAEFLAQDEILYRLGSRYVFVHLTMAGRLDHHVSMEWFDSWDAAQAELEHMNAEW
jgi:hypothetical protein